MTLPKKTFEASREMILAVSSFLHRKKRISNFCKVDSMSLLKRKEQQALMPAEKKNLRNSRNSTKKKGRKKRRQDLSEFFIVSMLRPLSAKACWIPYRPRHIP